MKKAEKEITVIKISQKYKEAAEELIDKLAPYLPNTAIVALDCAPNGTLNAFHYADGKNDAETLKELAPHLQNLDSLISQASKFKIDYQVGEKVGLWEKLNYEDFEEKIDWENAFVVKKQTGEMKIFFPCLNRKKAKGKINSQGIRRAGGSTKHDIIMFLYQPGANYYQPYFHPLPGPITPCRNTTYRLLFSREKPQESYFIAGLWVSTVSLRIKNETQIRTGLIIAE